MNIWKVYKTYKQFCQLHDSLKARYPEVSDCQVHIPYMCWEDSFQFVISPALHSHTATLKVDRGKETKICGAEEKRPQGMKISLCEGPYTEEQAHLNYVWLNMCIAQFLWGGPAIGYLAVAKGLMGHMALPKFNHYVQCQLLC